MKQALIYSLKVWLTTILIGSVIMSVKIFTFYFNENIEAWKFLYLVPGLGIAFGLLYFLPSWLILAVVSWYIGKKNLATKLTKVYLSILALILAIGPFAVMDYRSLFTLEDGWFAGYPPDLFWTCTYVFITLAGIWFYRLNPVYAATSLP